MPSSASFCGNCGAAKGTQRHFCEHCGAKVTAEQEFCTHCGQPLGSTQAQTTVAPTTSANPAPSAAQPTTAKTTSPTRPTAQPTMATPTSPVQPTATKSATVTLAGKTVKKSWLAGGIGAIVVLIVIIYMLIPKGLSGSYAHTTTLFGTTSTDTLTFKGKQVSEKGTSNTGTYTISGDTMQMTLGNTKMTAKLSQDKQSFTIESASGVAGLAAGLKYTKVK